MRLLRLELENFRSHGLLELDLEGVDAAAVVGPNGAGKSSILLAIEYALYGGAHDELLSRHADRGGVNLILEQAGKTWKVSRGRERGKKSWLSVSDKDGPGGADGWHTHAKRTMAESQELVEEAITGMDADAFRATVYAPQGEVGVLASLGPGARKALLGGLLGLEDYEEWREQAALDSRGAKSTAQATRERLEDYERRVEDARSRFEDTEELEQARASLAEQLEKDELELEKAIGRQADVEKVERRRQLVAQMGGVKERASAAKERAEKHAAAQARLAELGDVSEPLDAERTKKSAHDARVAAVESEKATLRRLEAGREQATAREKEDEDILKVIEGKIVDAEAPGAKCPTCHQEVKGEHRDAAIGELKEEQKRHIAKLVIAKQETAQAETDLEEALARSADDVGEFDTTRLRELEGSQAERARVEGQVDALTGGETVADLKTEWANLKVEAEKLPKEVPEGLTPDQVRTRITLGRGELKSVEDRLRADADARTVVKEIEEQMVEARAAAEQADLDERAYAVLAKAFSRDGIPAMILDNAVGGIEAATNETLEQLGVDMSIRLVTQRQTKTGNLSETLDILVDDGTTEAPLESFSGGEKARVHIALRLGLASVLTASTGLELGFLLIDEVPDVDTAGVELLAQLVSDLPQQILVVTHNEDILQRMPQRIRVDRAAGNSSQVTVAGS